VTVRIFYVFLGNSFLVDV